MRKRIFIVAAVTVIGLTGCASVPTLSEDQNNAMAEYIADNLLMHDKSYSNSIKLNSETETATPQPSVQPTVAPTPKVSVTPTEIQNSKTPSDAAQTIEEPKQTYVSMSDVLQVPGFKVKFDGYKFNSNISTKDSNISSKAGKKLFVAKLKFKNNTSSARKLDMTKNHSKYVLSVDGKQMDSPLLTIADEDIHFIKKKISAKKSLNAIVVFEIPAKIKLNNVVLEVTNKDMVAQLQIK